MNYSSVSRKAMPYSLPIAVGLIFGVVGLIMILSAFDLVCAASRQFFTDANRE